MLSITYRRAIQARERVAEALSVVVRERRIERERGIVKNDMLAALFDSDCDDGGVGFNDAEIVDFLVSLLVAGYDTTSTTMTLAVKFLTDTPLALAQLKEEHDEIRAKKTDSVPLEWEDYKSMPFTQCVIEFLEDPKCSLRYGLFILIKKILKMLEFFTLGDGSKLHAIWRRAKEMPRVRASQSRTLGFPSPFRYSF
ncbi:hypothetical protein E3N88_07416 [Mikania micrantha]|uniref:Uncharacterized protein n=1 Tax=Mikania micrantha TaxID=192012 RepID=A0A5N6PTV6_9ASTR|nr:hypothetical protein E3N88_07416 [Mikania micrantha]